MGLVVEQFGPDAVVVREVPSMLGKLDVKGLIRDLADEIAETGNALSLKERLEAVFRHACLPPYECAGGTPISMPRK